MLKEIKVINLAIIEDINLSFNNGMTALTGETGAGKSLIIDAIYLLLGSRADSDLIRYGASFAEVTGLFNNLNESLINALDKIGIKANDELVIYRKISQNNKNIIKINDTDITLQALKQIGLYLGDIHVQHDTYRLINKDNYLSFLDDYRNKQFLKLFNDYQVKRLSYFNELDKFLNIKKRNNDLKEKLDVLEFQKKELEDLGLEEDIDIKLEEEINKLSNYDKIYSNLNEAYEALNSEGFNLDILYNAKDNLDNIKEFDFEYKEKLLSLENAYYAIDEVVSYLYKAKDSLDFDPNYLEELNSRLYEINKIKDKYHKTVSELISYLDEITLQINLATNYDSVIKELEDSLKQSFNNCMISANLLSKYRKDEALKIEKALIKECKELDLENTNFKVAFNELVESNYLDKQVFKDTGIDDIDFLVSFNTGEPVKPLSKVASGGELSRLMLAFKIIYLNKNNLSFMVFDEIDSGISGSTARKIGKKLHEISGSVQVMAITHLAQVASLADTQIYIEKETINNRTKTNVKVLSYEERINQLAIMLSGMEVNSELLKTAKAMLDNK